jgi:hypothetical protein
LSSAVCEDKNAEESSSGNEVEGQKKTSKKSQESKGSKRSKESKA